MKICVIQGDIDSALEHKKAHPKDIFSCTYNPIAIACLRMGLRNKDKDYFPAVTEKRIFAWKVTEDLPSEAIQFLADFYNDLPVGPFSFDTTTSKDFPSWTAKDAEKVGMNCFFWWKDNFWWKKRFEVGDRATIENKFKDGYFGTIGLITSVYQDSVWIDWIDGRYGISGQCVKKDHLVRDFLGRLK